LKAALHVPQFDHPSLDGQEKLGPPNGSSARKTVFLANRPKNRFEKVMIRYFGQEKIP
jgi:hypothetical protein